MYSNSWTKHNGKNKLSADWDHWAIQQRLPKDYLINLIVRILPNLGFHLFLHQNYWRKLFIAGRIDVFFGFFRGFSWRLWTNNGVAYSSTRLCDDWFVSSITVAEMVASYVWWRSLNKSIEDFTANYCFLNLMTRMIHDFYGTKIGW